MTQRSPFRYFKTSPEIIRLAVMLYIRFPLSLRNVEDLLHERGIEISHETVHQPAAGCQPQPSSSGIGACVNSRETCQRPRARAPSRIRRRCVDGISLFLVNEKSNSPVRISPLSLSTNISAIP
jgi:hypothetical protein